MDMIRQISLEMQAPDGSLSAALALLDDGNTIPFIARYRKEVTGGLDENQLRFLEERVAYLRNLQKRKEEVRSTIQQQEKWTPALEEALAKAEKLQEVEDLYLPFRPKRRTRASIAKERGLEPLADAFLQRKFNQEELSELVQEFLNEELTLMQESDAIQGAQDILAERVSEEAELRSWVRRYTMMQGSLQSVAVDAEKSSDYLLYYQYEEPLSRIPPHRVLAINRGEREEVLKVKLITPRDGILRRLLDAFSAPTHSAATTYVEAAVIDGYDRLMSPSIERDIRSTLSETAETHAIGVFAENLRNLLLQPPVKNQIVMGVDPAFRTGCKLAVVDATGRHLDLDVIYPTIGKSNQESSRVTLVKLIEKYQVDCLAIGNGTASRETEQFVADALRNLSRSVVYTIVNEAGASVYSASKLAGEEFPALDVSQRSAISIARRLQDPLAELVKIDPKSIGVGLYQHDVNQKQLGLKLESVVESVVNHVGVDLNTASAELLKYVAGIKTGVAKKIVQYRDKNQRFENRSELRGVSGLGEQTFLQAAGFLRITEGDLFLDQTAIHPERYEAVEKLFTLLQVPFDITGVDRVVLLLKDMDEPEWQQLANQLGLGMPTFIDMMNSLAKPGRDPREDLPPVVFSTEVLRFEDLTEGMLLQGIVRNVVDFGCFVDIGVHQDGLVHISEISSQHVAHPSNAVKVGQQVKVKVISIDHARKRIGLSIKQGK